MKQAFVIMIDTICQGNVISCWGEKDEPVLFDTEVDAWKEIADTMVECLRQFIDGERQLENTDFGTEEFVLSVYVQEDGSLVDLAGGHVWKAGQGRD